MVYDLEKIEKEDPQERYRHILRNLAPVCQHMSCYNGPKIPEACDESIMKLSGAIQDLRRLKNDVRRNFKDQA